MPYANIEKRRAAVRKSHRKRRAAERVSKQVRAARAAVWPSDPAGAVVKWARKRLTYLVEVKDGDKWPSHRTLTPDQQRWIREWNGSPVVLLLDAGKALSWACRIAEAPAMRLTA